VSAPPRRGRAADRDLDIAADLVLARGGAAVLAVQELPVGLVDAPVAVPELQAQAAARDVEGRCSIADGGHLERPVRSFLYFCFVFKASAQRAAMSADGSSCAPEKRSICGALAHFQQRLARSVGATATNARRPFFAVRTSRLCVSADASKKVFVQRSIIFTVYLGSGSMFF
jgi:hypothetical protein